MLVSRVFQSCPPGVLQGEPGMPGLLLFSMGDPLGFTTVKEKEELILVAVTFAGERDTTMGLRGMHTPLFESGSWNILMAIVGPELAR